MVKKNVEHYSKWKKERISKHKKTTWKKYEKYIETEGGNFSSEIHYYKSHPVKPDKHPTHPDNESDESHNDEIKKRQDEHKDDLVKGKHNTMYAAATSVRKIIIPSHTTISQREQQQAQYANASKKYHENIKSGGTDATAVSTAQEYLNSVGLQDHIISPLSNRDSIVIQKPTGKIEISYRGTDKTHMGDLKTDARIIAGFEEGGTQFNRANEQINNVITEHGVGAIDHLSGYSLGGGKSLILGAKNNIEATGINPLVGKSLLSKMDTEKNLKIIRTTDDPASLGLVASEHPFEVKTVSPIKEGYALGIEPISQSYASHKLENFLDIEALRTPGMGSQELHKANAKNSVATEMEMLHTAQKMYKKGGTYTDYIHELYKTENPSTRSNRNQRENHSIVNGEKRLAGQKHNIDDIKVRTWDDVSNTEFTPQEAKYITDHNNPYEDNSHKNAIRDKELARVKNELNDIKPYSIETDPYFTDTRPSMAKTKSQMRDIELARVKGEIANMNTNAKFGLDTGAEGVNRPTKTGLMELQQDKRFVKGFNKKMTSLVNSKQGFQFPNEVIDPLSILPKKNAMDIIYEFPSVPKGNPLDRMIDARNPDYIAPSKKQIIPVEVPFPAGLEPPTNNSTNLEITNRNKQIKDGIHKARGQHNEEHGNFRELFGEGKDLHLHHDERQTFLELPSETQISKINKMRTESNTHAQNSTEHFATGETIHAPSGLKQLAGAFHPTSIAMGLGAGFAAEKSMNLIDKDHKIPMIPRGLITGGVAGGMGNLAARGLGVAGEKLVERGAISLGVAETLGIGAAGVGLLPEIIAGGVGYAVGEVGGMGISALVKEAGGDKKDQEWGAAVGGGALGGMASGAIIGSVVPGIGTAVGAGIGFVGGAVFGALSNLLG